MKNILLLLLIFIGPLVASAILPADPNIRVNDLIDYRQRRMDEFEQRKIQRKARLIEANRSAREQMKISPWRRNASADAAATSGGVVPSVVKQANKGSGIQRWTFSIIALLLLGGTVWWVKVKTEPE